MRVSFRVISRYLTCLEDLLTNREWTVDGRSTLITSKVCVSFLTARDLADLNIFLPQVLWAQTPASLYSSSATPSTPSLLSSRKVLHSLRVPV